MNKFLRVFSIFILFFTANTQAQTIEGEWAGILYQEDGGVKSEYYFSMNITKEHGKYTGNSYIQFIDAPETFGLMNFTGYFFDNIFAFKEEKILRQDILKNMYWCMKQARLNYTVEGDTAVLSGEWTSWKPLSCAPGTIIIKKALTKKNKPETSKNKDVIVSEMKKRKEVPNLKKPLNLKTKEFYIEVYDNGTIDGDIISLFFNGKPVLTNYELQQAHKRIKLSLDTNLKENKLLLHAHNLGRISPNTAAVLIISGDKVQQISMHSNMNESGIIKLKLDK